MILIGLGSSLPFWGRSPQSVLSCAVHALSGLGKVAALSHIYESAAWPDPSDPVFLNACIRLETEIAPEALLLGLHAIEAGFGRRRDRPNGPRTLDLDLLDYQGLRAETSAGKRIDLPHPRLATRDFVLLPLRDVAPHWRHPVRGEDVESLIAALESRSARRIKDEFALAQAGASR